MEIRLLLDHRNDLVAERARGEQVALASASALPRARTLMKAGSLNQSRVLDRVDRRLRRLPAGARVRIAREQVAQIRRLTRRADALRSRRTARSCSPRPAAGH
jgi:hypothetical protein